MSTDQQNHYEIIGVSQDASRERIEEQCIRLGEQYRPDKNPGDLRVALLFAQTEQAYKTLIDPAKRATYDAELRIGLAEADALNDAEAAKAAGDYAKAIKLWRPIAERENAKAQYGLGVLYANGQGVVQDYREAVKWFCPSAAQGNADAQYNLGECYYHGHGVERDIQEAVKWYRLAAAQGHILAQNSLRTNAHPPQVLQASKAPAANSSEPTAAHSNILTQARFPPVVPATNASANSSSALMAVGGGDTSLHSSMYKFIWLLVFFVIVVIQATNRDFFLFSLGYSIPWFVAGMVFSPIWWSVTRKNRIAPWQWFDWLNAGAYITVGLAILSAFVRTWIRTQVGG